MKPNTIDFKPFINSIHHKSDELENFSHTKAFTDLTLLGYSFPVVAKSTTERGNSNISQTANSSTPLNRAFFVRSIRTPKENVISIILSMVGRNGQRLIVGCIPFEAVFHPVMLYRQAWKLAVVPKIFQTELSSMIKSNQGIICHHSKNSLSSEFPINYFHFKKCGQICYSFPAVAKSTAEPRNSNNLLMANKSTPNYRAVFVCSERTPKENTKTKIGFCIFLSMVAFDGKGFALCCVPLVAVFEPVKRYRPTLESLAVAPNKSLMELSSMIYKFLLLGSQRLKITVRANNKAEALSKVKFNSKPLLIARLRNPIVNTSANMTACDTEQNNRLPNAGGCGYDDCTTTNDGNRIRYSSGIFLPQIYQNHGNTTPENYSEFAVRATPRNKAEYIRTNKGGYSFVAVEPLSHPFSDKPLSLTRTNDTMKKSNPIYTANNGTQTPIVSTSNVMGVQYA